MKRLLMVTALVLAGCASTPRINWNSETEIKPLVTATHDDFKRVTNWAGPEMITRTGSGVGGTIFLRAWRLDGSKDTRYQVYVVAHPDQWLFLERAYDSNGRNLPTTLISRDVGKCYRGGCFLEEHIAVNVDRAYMAAASATGMRFKLSGKNGDVIYSVPPAYISAMLSRVPEF